MEQMGRAFSCIHHPKMPWKNNNIIHEAKNPYMHAAIYVQREREEGGLGQGETAAVAAEAIGQRTRENL